MPLHVDEWQNNENPGGSHTMFAYACLSQHLGYNFFKAFYKMKGV